MQKRIFTLLLAVAASVGTLFASDTQVNGIWYNFNSSTKKATVTYRGSSPTSYSNEYSGSIVIPASVTYNSVTYSVTSIGRQAFRDCSGLTSVTIPNSVTSIGEEAFYASGLTSITIPNSVTSIKRGCFSCCYYLNAINVASDNPNYSSIDGVVFDKQQTELIYCPERKEGAYIIPNSVISIGYDAFGGCGRLTSVTIPNSVTSIGEQAFVACSGLTSITIPNSVTSIGESAFDFCNSLTSVTIEAEIPPTLGSDAFDNLHNCPIYVPCAALDAYKTAWSDYAFRIKYAPLPYKISTIAENGNVTTTDITTLTICDPSVICTVTADYGYHFAQWSDGNTDNPRIVWITQDTTFTAEFAKNSYTISTASANPEWGTTSGDKSVLYLENVIISATANYGYHFDHWDDYNTTNPRTISVTEDKTYTATFAKNVYTITKNAEHGSISGNTSAEYLDNITLTVTPIYGYHFTQWSDGVPDNPRTFVLTQDTTFTAEFAVDKSGTCGKDNLLQWTYADEGILTISGNGELTENYTFGVEAPAQMQTLIIGDQVTAVGNYAFNSITTIQKIVIGSNVTSIGDYAFADINNRQLANLVMPAELLTIGDYAFSGNTYLESIDFNAKLQSIGAYAFNDCFRVSEMTCLATITPDLGTDALASINSIASLCVPAECLRKYQIDPNWGRFALCELGASSTTTDGKTVTVEPSDNTALFTWPTDSAAASYSLQITKDGVVFCTLVFNSNGQLTGIAFAPSRNGASHAPAATMSVAGMSFTVTGLNSASKYAYRLAVADDASEELVAYSGEFATTGYTGEVNPGGNPEGIDTPDSSDKSDSSFRKILRDGQVLIQKGDKTYTLTGAEVK